MVVVVEKCGLTIRADVRCGREGEASATESPGANRVIMIGDRRLVEPQG